MMSGVSLLLAGALLVPAGTPEIVRLDTASWSERISFEAYRPGQRPLGYELTLVEKTELNLPSGKHPVLRMHYTNRVAKNSFDLIQMPVIPGRRRTRRCGRFCVRMRLTLRFRWRRG